MEKKLSRCFFDVEATGLRAESSCVVGYGVLDENGVFHHQFIQPVDLFSEEKIMCQSIIDTVSRYRQVVTHFGRGYDIRMVTSRSLLHGLDPSPLLRVNLVDIWEVARERLLLTKNTLDDLAKFFKIPKKIELKGSDMPLLYLKAATGDAQALPKIKEHCFDDLQALAKIFYKLKPIIGVYPYEKSRV